MEIELTVNNTQGLHSRPAGKLVNTAAKFKSEIILYNNEKTANAKRILSLLKLGAGKGSRLKIVIEGEDEEEAMIEIKRLFYNNFGE
jgi:phosphotransferase system HPr (HPr) family protein